MTGEVSKLGYKRGKTYGSHERVDSTRWVERLRRGEATAINRTTPRVQGLNHRTKDMSWTERGTEEEQDTPERQGHANLGSRHQRRWG